MTRGLVTQMSDTLIHKKQVQCVRAEVKQVRYDRTMHDIKWTFSNNINPLDTNTEIVEDAGNSKVLFVLIKCIISEQN